MSRLLDIIALFYRMQPEDGRALETDLLDRRKVAWAQALREMARKYGCPGEPNAPRRGDLAELKRMCRDDAQSIAATWQRDVDRQLQKLYKANPRGNRAYYAKAMIEWERARATWKNAQIALYTEQTTRFYAQNRFRQENGLRGRPYVFVGPAPTCPTCASYFGKGIVDEAFVQTHPAPVHINCPHEWVELPMKGPPCDELWLG